MLLLKNHCYKVLCKNIIFNLKNFNIIYVHITVLLSGKRAHTILDNNSLYIWKSLFIFYTLNIWITFIILPDRWRLPISVFTLALQHIVADHGGQNTYGFRDWVFFPLAPKGKKKPQGEWKTAEFLFGS